MDPNLTPPQVWYHPKLQQIEAHKVLSVLFPGRAGGPQTLEAVAPPEPPAPRRRGQFPRGRGVGGVY